jgi:hypothetical protein
MFIGSIVHVIGEHHDHRAAVLGFDPPLRNRTSAPALGACGPTGDGLRIAARGVNGSDDASGTTPPALASMTEEWLVTCTPSTMSGTRINGPQPRLPSPELRPVPMRIQPTLQRVKKRPHGLEVASRQD